VGMQCGEKGSSLPNLARGGSKVGSSRKEERTVDLVT